MRRASRILVVDDVEWFCALATKALQRHGYDAKAAYEARTALRLLKDEGPFDLVIIDRCGIDARWLVSSIRSGYAEHELCGTSASVPIVACSDFRGDGLTCDFFDAVLSKPFSASELLVLVGEILKSTEPHNGPS